MLCTCGNTLQGGVKFCCICGKVAPSAQGISCPNTVQDGRRTQVCGNIIESSNRFCNECAWRISSEAFLPGAAMCDGNKSNREPCDNIVTPNFRFCSVCGKHLKGQTSQKKTSALEPEKYSIGPCINQDVQSNKRTVEDMDCEDMPVRSSVGEILKRSHSYDEANLETGSDFCSDHLAFITRNPDSFTNIQDLKLKQQRCFQEKGIMHSKEIVELPSGKSGLLAEERGSESVTKKETDNLKKSKDIPSQTEKADNEIRVSGTLSTENTFYNPTWHQEGVQEQQVINAIWKLGMRRKSPDRDNPESENQSNGDDNLIKQNLYEEGNEDDYQTNDDNDEIGDERENNDWENENTNPNTLKKNTKGTGQKKSKLKYQRKKGMLADKLNDNKEEESKEGSLKKEQRKKREAQYTRSDISKNPQNLEKNEDNKKIKSQANAGCVESLSNDGRASKETLTAQSGKMENNLGSAQNLNKTDPYRRNSKEEVLQGRIEVLKKHIQSLESNSNSLQLTIDDLTTQLLNMEEDKEKRMQSFNRTLSDNQDRISELDKELTSSKRDCKILKERHDLTRQTLDEANKKNHDLLERVQKVQSNNVHLAELMSKEREKEHKISSENQLLRKRVQEMSLQMANLKTEKSEMKRLSELVEKDNFALKRKLNKLRSEEIASKSILEKGNQDRTLNRLEEHNTELQKQVQQLQAWLAEAEQQNAQRLIDLTTRHRAVTEQETERLRSAHTQAERMLETRERNHRAKVRKLEETIAMLENQLAVERWRKRQQYNFQSACTSDETPLEGMTRKHNDFTNYERRYSSWDESGRNCGVSDNSPTNATLNQSLEPLPLKKGPRKHNDTMNYELSRDEIERNCGVSDNSPTNATLNQSLEPLPRERVTKNHNDNMIYGSNPNRDEIGSNCRVLNISPANFIWNQSLEPLPRERVTREHNDFMYNERSYPNSDDIERSLTNVTSNQSLEPLPRERVIRKKDNSTNFVCSSPSQSPPPRRRLSPGRDRRYDGSTPSPNVYRTKSPLSYQKIL